MNPIIWKKIGKIVGLVLAGIVVLIGIAVAAIYLWPLGNAGLRQVSTSTLDYPQAVAKFETAVAAQQGAQYRSDCRNQLHTHGQKTAKAVVMFHGFTDCPAQFTQLANYFFERGYNVYVPLAPRHGLTEQRPFNKLEATDLVQYADAAMAVGSGLGEEVGVIGISGGGVMATWAAHYRPETTKRLLAISPFYEPSEKQAPKWQIKPLAVLYGFGLLPDTISGWSYHGLAQYLRIVANFKRPPGAASLKSVGVVYAQADDNIDHKLARQLPTELAAASHIVPTVYTPPVEWGVTHDLVGPNSPDNKGRAIELYPIYFDIYEGKQP